MHVPRRILCVDDDPQFTALLAKRLQKFGYTTTEMCDPAEVLRHLPRLQERVVVLDLDMPVIGGLELLQEIKQSDGAVQVVVVTGIVTMATVLQTLRCGAEACFFKPVTDIRPLVDGLDACFAKLDRWWTSLDELLQRKKSETELVATAEPMDPAW